MPTDGAGLQRWTRRFTLASAAAFGLSLVTIPVLDDPRTAVLLSVFGFVCPMVFGMAYLLLPPYVGRTLVDHRLPGIHFATAYLGAALLVVGWRLDGTGTLFSLGAVLWTVGVGIFVGSLLATVAPALLGNRGGAIRGGDRPQRSSPVATAAIPVAVGYLVVGTSALLAAGGLLDLGPVAVPQVIHYYLIGFGALLVFALGGRLLIGFFHVTPPRPLIWVVIITGALAPGFLGSGLWLHPWFRVGGVLAATAMGGYLLLVGYVAVRTDRTRPGLYGIVLGAIAGTVAVGAAVPFAFGAGGVRSLGLHRTAILAGFFPLTIVGYAYRFFPVSGFELPGTDVSPATLTIGLLGLGVVFQGAGILAQAPLVRAAGIGSSLLGTVGYAALLTRRFVG